jgi:hypothetical protein
VDLMAARVAASMRSAEPADTAEPIAGDLSSSRPGFAAVTESRAAGSMFAGARFSACAIAPSKVAYPTTPITTKCQSFCMARTTYC